MDPASAPIAAGGAAKYAVGQERGHTAGGAKEYAIAMPSSKDGPQEVDNREVTLTLAEPEGEPVSQARGTSHDVARLGDASSDSADGSVEETGLPRPFGHYDTMPAAKRGRKPTFVPGAMQPSMAKAFFNNICRMALWFALLEKTYGTELMWLLFAAQHLLKGVVQQLQASSMMWLFMEYHISGPQMQVYMSIASSAWALKPIIGLTSDLVPILGFRKGPYCILASLIGVASTTLVGFSTLQTASVTFIVMCLWGVSLQVATCDLLTEAKYSEHLSQKPEYGPDLITYVWGGVSVGNMIAIAVVGWLIVNMGPRSVFLACIFPCAVILAPCLANYFEEQPLTHVEILRDRDSFWEQSEVLFLCALMTGTTLFLSAQGMFFDSQTLHFVSALAVLVVLLPTFHLLLRPEIAKVNTFFVLQSALSLTIGGATFYFYTDTPQQYPEGPHFTPTFFATTLGLVSCAFSLAGLIVYTQLMKDWTYRSLLLMSNLLVTVLSLLDVVLFLRLNVSAGVPDSLFVLGSSVCSVAVRQWQWMPGVVIMSQLCPTGMEATMFAMLAGCANVGSQIADYFGAFMLDRLGVHPFGASGESRQFDNLWKASLISTLLPSVTIALIPLLVPDARQTDKLLMRDAASATSGSLYSRCRRR